MSSSISWADWFRSFLPNRNDDGSFGSWFTQLTNGEIHMVGTNYVGPGTARTDRVVLWWLDELARRHDALYSMATGPEDIRRADEEFVHAISTLIDSEPSTIKRLAAGLASKAISAKMLLAGLVSYPNTFATPSGDKFFRSLELLPDRGSIPNDPIRAYRYVRSQYAGKPYQGKFTKRRRGGASVSKDG